MVNTRGDMKNEIASILKRSDLSAETELAIGHAVVDLQTELLFFNKTLTASFTCVVGQVYYDGDDDADIPLMNQFDAIHARISNTDIRLTRFRQIDQFETLNDGNVANGQPRSFVFYDGSIGVYPPPDNTYVINMYGGYDAAPPANDAEANNVWMTKGYQAVMYRSLEWLNRFHIRDYKLAGEMGGEYRQELDRLHKKTVRLARTGRVRPTSF